MPLQDEVIVITGASRGIGKTLALAFADAGAIVVASARKATGPDSIDETVEPLQFSVMLLPQKIPRI